MANFRQAVSSSVAAGAPDALTPNPTNPIPRCGRAAIVGTFDLPDGTYDYDATVDGAVVADPQLEI